MPLSYLIPAGMSLIGGLLGSEEKTVGKTAPTSQTTNSSSSHGSSTQNRIDPRMEQAIYGTGGIMPNASAWYAKNSSGLNDKMITGMNNQWNQLGSSKQGFDMMQNLGMGLMGGGAAGNPFTGSGGISPQQMSYKPAEFNANTSANTGTTSPFVMPEPTAAPAPAMMPSYDTGGGGGGGYVSEPQPAQVAAPAAPAVDPRGVWVDDVEGGMWRPHANPNAGSSGYRAQDWSNPSMNVPTDSTAGYGGYGGYSTLPAYSYPSNGGGGE